ncbi:MAG TPA: hypothetical protein VFI95_17565 [Terriglobales bacterium]|nr:hypothetical protein [Terriglobales bacterium]
MRKLALSFLVAPLLLPIPAAGQTNNGTRSSAPKSITVSGRISEDGKSLAAKNGESWSATNPEMLAGRVGQQVKVKCQRTSADHFIRVLSVKVVATPTTYHLNLGDSAFRR